MKYLLFLLLLSIPLFSQTKSLQMINEDWKTVFIKEDKRVKITTLDGKAHFGRVKFIDENHLILRTDTIAIAYIQRIQKRSVGKAVMTGVVIGLGGIAVTVGGILAITGAAEAGVVIASGYVAIPGGILISPLGRNYRSKHWKYKVVEQ